MKKLLKTLLIIAMLLITSTAFCVKMSDAQLKKAREKDNEWKEYVRRLHSDIEKTFDIEIEAKLWVIFESWNPYTGNFKCIKDKIVTKHKIKKYKEIKIPTKDGLRLDGWFIPVDNPKATMIIIHGWGSDVEFALCQSKFLLDLGYQLIIYNARFWNFYNKPDEYVGNLANDIDDIGATIKYASNLKGVDKDKLGIMGFSYGAKKAITAGALYPELKCVIADASPIKEDQTEVEKIHSVQLQQFLLKKYGFAEARPSELEPMELIDKISPRPVMLMHGGKDNSVPIMASEKLYEKALEPKSFHIYPNSSHCLGMLSSDKEQYIADTKEFLSKVF